MNSGNIVYVNLEELSKVDYKLVDGEADIKGWPVTDETGRSIGKVKDLLVDPEHNAVRYVIVDLEDEVSGTEEKAVLFPIGFVKLGEDKKEVVLPVMHESQFIEMPQYIIGEITRDTELKIRSAIGSPAALRIEEEIIDLDQSEFYRHHHFDRGNRGNASSDLPLTENVSENATSTREEESNTIHELVNQAESRKTVSYDNEQPTAGKLEQFDIDTEKGIFTIDPQENGTYRILEKENKIGVIYAEAAPQDGIQWKTMDQLDDRFVSIIGEGITAYHQSSSNI